MLSKNSSLLTGAILSAVLVLSAGMSHAQGVAGPYLSARQAEARGDIGEAARLYAETLARDRDNEDVLERAMIHQIAAGLVPDGIALARRYEEV